jgi:hypothetical protein
MLDTILTVASILVAAAALLWGVKSYRDQMNAQLFLEFTKRFEEVMQSFPKNTWPSRLNIEGKPPPKSKALSLSALRYLNLCSEEYYLRQKDWLYKETWEIWERELIRTLQTPLFRREWKTLSNEFESYPEFKEYVDNAQKVVES